MTHVGYVYHQLPQGKGVGNVRSLISDVNRHLMRHVIETHLP